MRALVRGTMAVASKQNPTRSERLTGMTPLAVAAGLRHLPGMVFFDLAVNLPASAKRPVSVIAALPTRILRGSIPSALGSIQ